MNIYSVYRCDTPNIGDAYAAPRNYFDFLAMSRPVDIKSLRGVVDRETEHQKIDFGGAALIVGGGGLLDNDYFRDEISLISGLPATALRVLWGTGQNNHAVRNVSSLFNSRYQDLSSFDLVGIRDYPNPWEWVPCASCMHEYFSQPAPEPTLDIVSYLHYDPNLHAEAFNEIPHPLYNKGTFDQAIEHISRGALVLTNSFHGAYWAQLLGRKVIAFPTTSKLLHYRFPIPLCDPTEWRRYTRFAYVAEEALAFSREANTRFAAKVAERLLCARRGVRTPQVPTGSGSAYRTIQPSSKTAVQFDSQTIGEIVHKKIAAVIACPQTHGPIDVVPLETTAYATRKATLWSRTLNKTVGEIKDFQYDFLRYDDSLNISSVQDQFKSGSLPVECNTAQLWTSIDVQDPRITYCGSRTLIADEGLMCVEGAGATISFEAAGTIEILFSAHPWSGIVDITHSGRKQSLDLYEPHTTVPRPLRIAVGAERTRIEIAVTGAKNPNSFASQCLLGGLRFETEARVPFRYDRHPRLRGASFGEPFHALLDRVPEDGLLLDIGGGNRQVRDARYCNLDYAPYLEPDVIGDAMCLPFRSCSVDAVYSSGVFEHIPNPIRAGAEVARVLKVGGKAVVCWAFLQPIHSEGQHFFNATPWGVRYAFQGLRLNRMWFDTSLAFLNDWMVKVSGVASLVETDEKETVLEFFRKVDGLIPDCRKQYAASGIWCELEKV